jgi:hypothetical protein
MLSMSNAKVPPRYVPAKKLTGRSSLYPNTSNATPTRNAAPLISCAGALAVVSNRGAFELVAPERLNLNFIADAVLVLNDQEDARNVILNESLSAKAERNTCNSSAGQKWRNVHSNNRE